MRKHILFVIFLFQFNGIIAQPDELFRGRHFVSGGNYGHPYTTFDRYNGDLSLNETVEKIRNRVFNEKRDGPVFKAYGALYNFAVGPMPRDGGIDNGAKTGPSALALWAKCNAFVFLIGLDSAANWLDTTTYNGNKSFNKRNEFRDRVYHPTLSNNYVNAFAHLTDKMPKFNEKSYIQFASRSLIHWLTAYDLLKASFEIKELKDSQRYVWGFGDADRNLSKSSPRDKLRQLTRDLYQLSTGWNGIVEHQKGWKKNHGIAAASCLLLAAQTLNDAGVETNILRGIFSGSGYNPTYSPVKWNKLGSEGLQENLFEGKHIFPWEDVPQSPKNTNKNSYSVYAEGIAYVNYGLLDCGLPALRAQKNLYPQGNSEVLLNKNEIINIFNWVDRLRIGNYSLPTFDNSGQTDAAILSLTGINEFNYGVIGSSLDNYLVEYVALVGGNNIMVNNEMPRKFDAMLDAGNIIIRNETKKSFQTFLMLCEKDYAVDKASSNIDGTHEDDEMGSWSLFVQDSFKAPITQLAVDPPYGGYSLRDGTNKFNMHNVIQIHTLNTPNYDEYKYPKFEKRENSISGITEFNLVYDWKEDKNSTLIGNAITRNVISLNLNGNIYYILNDFVDGSNIEDFTKTTLILNGNGNKDDSTYRKLLNLHVWNYPCNNSGNWLLATHHASLKGGIPSTGYDENTLTKNEWNFTGSAAEGISGGYLTRLKIDQTNDQTIYQSFIYPQKCGDSLPTVTKRDTFENLLTTEIDFIQGVDTSFDARLGKSTFALARDTVSHLHLVKWEGGSDSLSNPFNRPNQAFDYLFFDGSKLFLENHTLSYMGVGFGYCPPSYINLRKFIAYNSSYLIFKDTLFHSTIGLDFDYSVTGKNNYTCQISTKTTPSSTDTLKLKLPEVGRGMDMVALIAGTNDTLHGRYDSLSNYIYLALKPGNYAINIEPSNPCLDCYFPPNGTDFDTLFIANSKNHHTLGNSKKINANHGNLSIVNSTKVNMCAGVILHNKDSLIIEGPAQKEKRGGSSCAGIDSLIKGSDNSMLIVSPYAALVLDAGSHTYVKNGAGLYIKQNGSLIVKSGAVLEVGDSGTGGWGEIIAEPGAFIYIEDNAVIRYRRRIGDTSDNNTINFAVGSGGVIAGVQFYIDSILKADTILPTSTYPIAICALDTINPIGNRHWGYTNFGRPEAKFFTRSLTLCPKEPFYIKLNRLLNDAQLEISVCRVDSVWRKNQDGNWHWKDTCINDSIVLDSMPPDPSCLAPRVAPEDWLWYFPVNTIHRVYIAVKNECGMLHDTLVEVSVLDSPTVTLTAPANACEGYGTLKAVATINRSGPVHYAFEVTEIPDTAALSYQLGNPSEEYSFDTIGIVPDTFDFPSFYFKGGRKYIVSFTYLNDCGTVTKEQEVEIPTGALITFERPTVYANPVHGARTVQLHGYVNSADSFSWSPPTWLNRTDTLVVISTPGDSISYVLTAYQGSCIAYDTAFIKYNRVANAGLEDTVCYTSTKVLLGNSYDLSVFLGYLYYKGGSDFRDNWFIAKTTSDPEYFKYLSMFMQTNTFKSWAMGAGNLYLHFTEELNREGTIKEPWFANYFETLTEFTDPDMYALDTFVTLLSRNTNLADSYNATGNYTNFSSGFSNFFSYYDDFVANYLSTVSMSWIKITGADTSFNSSLQESAIAIDEPTRTTNYIQQVITPEYAEIDETIVYVDTIPTVAFAVQLQLDSTVVFENYTEPTDGSNRYSWNFGDGSATSNQVHPYHTFPAFDTLFRVCLTATNDCGSYTWCDTVYIDSAHWGGNMRIWGEEGEREGERERARARESAGGGDIEAFVYPNPTEGNTTLQYTLSENATLVITDAQGKLIWQTELKASGQGSSSVIGPPSSSLLLIPSQSFANGLYFYTLQTTLVSARGKFVVKH